MGRGVCVDLPTLEDLRRGLEELDFSALDASPHLLARAGAAAQLLDDKAAKAQKALRDAQNAKYRAKDADERERLRRSVDQALRRVEQIEDAQTELRAARADYVDRTRACKERCEARRDEICQTLARAIEEFEAGAAASSGMGTAGTSRGHASAAAPRQAAAKPGASSWPAGCPQDCGSAVTRVPDVADSQATEFLRIGGLHQRAEQVASATPEDLNDMRAQGKGRSRMPRSDGKWTDLSGTPCAEPGLTGTAVWNLDANAVPAGSANPKGLSWGRIMGTYGAPLSVVFEGGYPIFPSQVVLGELKGLGPLTGNRLENYRLFCTAMLDGSAHSSVVPWVAAQAERFMQERAGCTWFRNQSDVMAFLKYAGLTPHETHRGTVQLIPTVVHDNIPHLGAVANEGLRARELADISDALEKIGKCVSVQVNGNVVNLGVGSRLSFRGAGKPADAMLVGDKELRLGLKNISPERWKLMKGTEFTGATVSPGSVLGLAMKGACRPSLRIEVAGSIVDLTMTPNIDVRVRGE